MQLSFEKWQACKNDFILIWPDHPDSYLELAIRNQARNLCAKDGGGIAADGILYVNGSAEEPELVIINSDGSEAKHCGNGIRCVAMAALQRIQSKQKNLPVGLNIKLKASGHSVPAQFLLNETRSGLEPDLKNDAVFASLDIAAPERDEAITWHSEFSKEFERLLKTFCSFQRSEGSLH